MHKDQQPHIRLTALSSLPDSLGTISQGVSGAYAGMLDGHLVLAGGCNFPNEPATQGGEKVYYKEIVQWHNEKWTKIGELPQPMAYGTALTYGKKLLLIGGNNAQHDMDNILAISIQNNRCQIDTLTTMPFTAHSFATAQLPHHLYLFGGVQNGKPSNALWRYDTQSQQWKVCQSLPDRPLQQSQLVSANGQLYLFGGFDAPNDTAKAYVSQDIWRYSPTDDQWSVVATYPKGENNYSLSGGCAVQLDKRYILTLAGVNQKVFEKALDTFYYLQQSSEKSTTTYQAAQEEKKQYLHHPTDWYAFNSQIYLFDTENNEWIFVGTREQTALAGATMATIDSHKVVLLNGEIKPGVRTPQNWIITTQQPQDNP